MDKASYFEKLVETLSRIASHSYYPGKEDAVEQCLEEVEEIRLSGQITDRTIGGSPGFAPRRRALLHAGGCSPRAISQQ